eukprot:gene23428-31774_t
MKCLILIILAFLQHYDCSDLDSTADFFDLDSINLPDYVHVPLDFTLNTKKFSESADMTVSMVFKADAAAAVRLNLPQKYLDELELCWIKITEDEDLDEIQMEKGLCHIIPNGETVGFHTTVGTKWMVSLPPPHDDEPAADGLEVLFDIDGGKFTYDLIEIVLAHVEKENQELGQGVCYDGESKEQCEEREAAAAGAKLNYHEVAYVNNPHTCGPPGAAFDYMGPTWRDGVRTAAYRHGLALCFCGNYNDTSHTTYTLETPNLEYPTLPNQGGKDLCDCNNMNTARSFDYWFPCHFNTKDPGMMLQNIDCEVQVDRLSMKQKMWDSAKSVFGNTRAGVIMPMSFNLLEPLDQVEKDGLMQYCKEIIESGKVKEQIFVTKNVNLHQQHGISLASADALYHKGVSGGFSFATAFLAKPFTVNGYKINMRRYLVAVCTVTPSGEHHLRGYVHDDGKNIFTKYKYRDPWVGEDWEGKPDAIKRRLGELITSGYVPAEHFDDKPLSGIEFFSYVDSLQLPKEVDRSIYYNSTVLQQSMWTRLALTMVRLYCSSPPSCTVDSIRFQHFGCDFHIDKHISGKEAKLFECNKGPDFSTHSPRDGKLKREVAADIVSFMKLRGGFA